MALMLCFDTVTFPEEHLNEKNVFNAQPPGSHKILKWGLTEWKRMKSKEGKSK